MPSFAARLLHVPGTPHAPLPQSCTIDLGEDSLGVVPAAGPPLSVDLGNVDRVVVGDYELTLSIWDGTELRVDRFGKAWEPFVRALVDAHRSRLVRCLLLQDLEERARFEGRARFDSGDRASCEIRLYESNVAVMPASGVSCHWRLADVDRIEFDEVDYAIAVRAGGRVLVLDKLGKRTRELLAGLEEALAGLQRASLSVVGRVFPFLPPEGVSRAAALLRDGRPAALADLAAIHPRMRDAVVTNMVGPALAPYFDALCRRAAAEGPYCGFKLVRESADEDGEEPPEQETAGEARADEPTDGEQEDAIPEAPADESGRRTMFWFLVPVAARTGGAANAVAWESTSKTGRATYLFDPSVPIEELARGLAAVNFRREPVYLSSDALTLDPARAHYAIAARRLEQLRAVRSAFMGRAIHRSLPSWERQLDGAMRDGAARRRR